MEERWSIARLNTNNYSTWKLKVKHLLIAKDLFDYVDGTAPVPESSAQAKEKAEYNSKQAKALSNIILSVDDEVLYLISECSTAQAAWEKLQAHFERDTLANRLFLKKKYFRTVMSENASMESHLKHMKSITDKLAAIKAPVSEEDQVVTLLGSLPEYYDTIVTALEARGDGLTLEFVQNALLNEEQKKEGEQRLPGKTGVSGSVKHPASSDTALSADREYKRECYNCKSTEHMIRDCPKPRQGKQRGRGRGRGQQRSHSHKANVSETSAQNDSEEYGFSTGDNPDLVQEWLMDSGATRHMTPDKAVFKTYTPLDKPEKVMIADGRSVDAIAKGNIPITVRVNRRVTRTAILYDVLHVPDLKQNLFSVKSATDRGMIIQFGHTRAWVKNKIGQTHAMGTRVGKLYYLDLDSSYHRANLASCNTIWHQRLAHVNQSTIQQMNRESLVTGADLADVSVGICEPCIKGKMAHRPYKAKGYIKTRRVLELVHTDVCGPMQNQSIGGSRYFVSFIDDYSRFVHVYFIKNKSDVFSVFQEYQALVTNQTGQTIGTLRSDRGGEYISEQLEQYLRSEGIRHELTVRYAHQQNGLAERFNRTVCEAARAMIVESGLSKSFWAEAVNTAVYVRNRVPTTAHKVPTTPYQMWYDRKPDISHLRTFGCTAYAYVAPELRQKLDDKAETMIHMGYSLRSKGYRLYDLEKRNIVIRRDVIFDESKLGMPASSPVGEDNSVIRVDVNTQSQTCDEEPRRSTHSSNEPVRYGINDYTGPGHAANYVTDIVEPKSMKEAQASPQSPEWLKVADSEYQAQLQNETWRLVELPSNRTAIGCRWVFKAKYGPDGNVEKYKARLVAKGFAQQHGIDYEETFAPVVQRLSLRALLAYAVSRNMLIHQMDVITAFLNGDLSEEIYMEQPEGFVSPGREHLVCKLQRSLYGLKQASRCWNQVLDVYLRSIGFTQSSTDQCVYIKQSDSVQPIIDVYVDDLVILSDQQNALDKVKQALSARFQMKDLGELKFCLGIQAEFSEDSLKLHQKQYIQQMLRRYNMSEC